MKKRWGNLKLIEGENRGRYPFCHTLFWDGDSKVLIDPGCGRDKILEIADNCDLDAILLSHYHEDHFGWMSVFPDADLYIHAEDAPAIEDTEKFIECYGIERGGESEMWLRKMLDGFYGFEPRKADVSFLGGEVLDFGDLRVEVIHTPGHSPGHSCFYFVEPDVLFLADFDLTPFGPWYGDLVGDIDAFLDSSEKVRYHPASYKVVAHDEPVFSGDIDEIWENYLAVIDRREERLLEFLKEPRSMDEIVDKRIVYGKRREPAAFYDFGEKATMLKHIERLAGKGMVAERDGRYFGTG